VKVTGGNRGKSWREDLHTGERLMKGVKWKTKKLEALKTEALFVIALALDKKVDGKGYEILGISLCRRRKGGKKGMGGETLEFRSGEVGRDRDSRDGGGTTGYIHLISSMRGVGL